MAGKLSRILLAALLSLTAAGQALSAQKFIKGAGGHDSLVGKEGINDIPVSNYEINRLVADQKIISIKMDETAQVSADPNGESEFFIKIDGSRKELIYITTEDAVYTARLSPERIPAQNIKLVGEKKSVLPIIGNEREKLAVRLIKAAYMDDELIKKAHITRLSERLKLIEDIEIAKHLRYDFEDGVYLMVFIVRLSDKYKGNELRVSEKDFMLPQICDNPIGLSLSGEVLTKNAFVRLFVVGRDA